MTTDTRIPGQGFQAGLRSQADTLVSGEAGPLTHGDLTRHRLLDLVGAVRMLSETVEELVERRLQREIAGERLSHSQWKLLEIFALTEVGNVTDLATFQGVSTAAASKAVDRLVRLGLLIRTEDPDDRRHICLTLSEEGRHLINTYLNELERRITQLFPSSPLVDSGELTETIEELLASSGALKKDLEQICSRIHLTRYSACVVERKLGGKCSHRMNSRARARLSQEIPTTA
jgi:DNA-binding MarR family transcriptional regulator